MIDISNSHHFSVNIKYLISQYIIRNIANHEYIIARIRIDANLVLYLS